jgi:hypothetical protein
MTTTTADDLRTNLIGTWTLQSYESSRRLVGHLQ